MNNNIHLIMPMAGRGSRFYKNGFMIPKPLIEINDRPFFYWATQSIKKNVNIKSLTFVILQEHIDNFKIDQEIKKYFPDAKIEVVPKVLDGPVLTCLVGVKNITDDNPIVFNDCDHIFRCASFDKFCNDEKRPDIDGALLTFTSNDPKFSFLEYDEKGNVVRTVEKIAVSNNAICGAYYFKNRKIFEECSMDYLKVCNYSEYFVSGVYNVMADKGLVIKGFNVDVHIPFGTPEEYKEALESNEFGRLR